MGEHRHYVPILKLKQGERGALEVLPEGQWRSLTPLLEVPPPRWLQPERQRAKRLQSLEELLVGVGAQLRKALGSQRGWVDGLHLPETWRMADGQHPMEYLLGEARLAQARVVPVTGLRREDAYQSAVKRAWLTDARGVCLRVPCAELFEPGFSTLLGNWRALLGIEPSEVDLIIDCGELKPELVSMIRVGLSVALGSLPHVEAWRSLTVAGGSFPASLKGVATVGQFPRLEWRMWRDLVSQSARLPRLPWFGDYGVQSPAPASAEALLHLGSANIRYTEAEQWLVLRGRSIARFGFEQYHALSAFLIRHQAFRGRDFSWGDGYIFECAGEVETSGNASTWRRVGTSHHLAVVLNQLASLPSP